jgi:hypothetical protein
MVAEVYGGISALKAAFDIAKGLKDINDATIRNATAIELQEKILAALATQSELADRIRQLEQEVANFETWEIQKEQYELKSVAWGAFAYMLKPEARGTKPPHWLCTRCYDNRKTSIMQYFGSLSDFMVYKCPECSAQFKIDDSGAPKWID